MSTDVKARREKPVPERSRFGFVTVVRPGSRLDRVKASHSYGFVLVLILASFAFMSLAQPGTWSKCILVVCQTGTLTASLWTSGLRQDRTTIPVIAVVGFSAVLALAISGSSTTKGIVGAVQVVFLVASCVAIAVGVFDQREVNKQSVLGAVSIYLTIGLFFTMVYGAVADLGSGPFFDQGSDGTPAIRLYFSFVTLATLGYGDYTPRSDLGRMLAVLEALTGQLYLVTVVAVLVANLGQTRIRTP